MILTEKKVEVEVKVEVKIEEEREMKDSEVEAGEVVEEEVSHSLARLSVM